MNEVTGDEEDPLWLKLTQVTFWLIRVEVSVGVGVQVGGVHAPCVAGDILAHRGRGWYESGCAGSSTCLMEICLPCLFLLCNEVGSLLFELTLLVPVAASREM